MASSCWLSWAAGPSCSTCSTRSTPQGLAEVVVVLGDDADAIEQAIDWRGERRVRNPDPRRGLSSSLSIGLESVSPTAAAALIVLGDQPGLRADTVRALLAQPADAKRPVIVPRYDDDSARNPVLLGRTAFALALEASGDRGLGPVLASHPELIREVPVAGSNPDVDTPADLARAIEASWGARVRANREQVDRIREVPDGQDFYAPVRSLFRADPTRTDDPLLAALLALVRPGDTWLDVGAGAGRFALPLARALDPSGGSVVALDVSPSMLEALEEIAEDYAIENVRTVESRWPPDGSARDFRRGRRAHRACRLRRRGDRTLPRRARSGEPAPVRGGPDGAGARVGRRPVLAAGPRRAARRAAGASRRRSSCSPHGDGTRP